MLRRPAAATLVPVFGVLVILFASLESFVAGTDLRFVGIETDPDDVRRRFVVALHCVVKRMAARSRFGEGNDLVSVFGVNRRFVDKTDFVGIAVLAKGIEDGVVVLLPFVPIVAIVGGGAFTSAMAIPVPVALGNRPLLVFGAVAMEGYIEGFAGNTGSAKARSLHKHARRANGDRAENGHYPNDDEKLDERKAGGLAARSAAWQ